MSNRAQSNISFLKNTIFTRRRVIGNRMYLVIGMLVLASACSHVSTFLTEDTERVMVRRLSTHYDRHKRSVDSECSFPPLIRFEFDINNVHIILNLEKNTFIQHNIPIYVTGENGNIVKDEEIDDTQKYALYQDVNQGGAMLVSCEWGDSYSLHGSFRYEGVLYHMTPSNTAEILDDHIIHRGDTNKVEYGMDAIKNANTASSSNNTNRSKRATIPPGNVVEMVFAIDYYTYNYYGADVAAEDSIRRHIAMLANEMDIYYAGIPSVDPSVDIRIYVSSIYINTDSETSDWSTNAQTTVNDVLYLPYDALVNTIQPWLSSKSADLQPYDHVMTMSVIEFASVSGDTIETGYTGVAYVGTVCDTITISFTQLEYNGRTAQTMAHELGHALSANHDGYENACDENDHNVMTPAFYLTTTSTLATAQWTFSTCSVNYFKQYIDGLGSNCMQSHSFSESDYNTHVGYGLPGEYYSTTDQCAMFVGAASTPCSITDTVLSDDCYNGYRCSNESNNCGSSKNLYPMAGTKCGDSTQDYICYRGTCQDRTVVISTTPRTTSTTSSTISTSSRTDSTSSQSTPTSSRTESTSSSTESTSSKTESTSSSTESTSSRTESTSSRTDSTTSKTTSTTPMSTTSSPCDSDKKCCVQVRVGKKMKKKCCKGTECCEKPDWFSTAQCYKDCCEGDTTNPSTPNTTPTPTPTTTLPCDLKQKCCENVQLGKKLKKKCCKGQSCCARPNWFSSTQCYKDCCDVASTTSTPKPITNQVSTTKQPCNLKEKCCTDVQVGKKIKKKCCKGLSCCDKPDWYSSTSCYESCCNVVS
ncbi:hypothetical protein ACF0H5_016821 [Mactra antiquata]